MLPNTHLFDIPVSSQLNLHAALQRRFFRFAYPLPGLGGGDVLPHQLRDADAALFLHARLTQLGFEYAGPIINYPCARADAPDGVPVDDTFLRPGDLVLLTTRPPLHDEEDGVKSRVQRSHTTLEAKIFECLRQHLLRCSRRQVILPDARGREFPDVAKYLNVEFKQTHGAPIRKFQPLGSRGWQRPPPGAHSLAYLIYEEQAWPGGPAMLASFGICGTDTLVWNQLLAKRFPQLICSVSFAMALLTPPPRVGSRRSPGDLSQGWEVSLLTHDTNL
jgi:hypothetical protein